MAAPRIAPRIAPAEELTRQRLILLRERPERVALGSLAFALCAIIAEPRPLLAAWAVYLLAETIGPWLNRPERLLKSRVWYACSVVHAMLGPSAYMLAAGMVWDVEGSFSKAFAVGMTMMNLMHLATVRAIHLPTGLAGLSAVAMMILVVTVPYWLERGDLVGLALNCSASFGAVAYTLTAMIANNRLHRSMAFEEATARAERDAKTLFLAQMSHELRTPLNAIVGMAQSELAQHSAGDASADTAAPRPDRVRLILDNARMLASILDDVTDLNAADHGRLRLRLRTVHLCQELAAIVGAFEDRAQRLGVPFTLVCDGVSPGLVRVDAVRLRQCVGNLLSNALRHSAGSPIFATAHVEPDGQGGGLLVMDVSDSGPGVPEDQREAIFQSFERGRAAVPGSGLGLAVARTLARLMGGDLQLLPRQPGAPGATFRLTARYHPAQPEAPDSAPPDLAGRMMLVVDDIATNRLVAIAYLRQWGARVHEAASGEEALTILADDDMDLMLLDMNMPGLDGMETIRRIRMMGGRALSLPIVAMTADVMDDQVAAFRMAGADGHVPKPVLPEVLAAELRRLL